MKVNIILNRRNLLFAFLIFGLLLYNQASGHPDHAFVLNVEGTVLVKSGTDQAWDTLRVGQQLITGDSILTNENSTARLVYFNGSEFFCSPNMRYRLSETSQSDEESGLTAYLTKALNWFFMQDSPDEKPGVRGKEGEPPELLNLRYGKILSRQFRVIWLSSGEDISYTVSLFNDSTRFCNPTDDLIWEKNVQDTLLNYPKDQPLIEQGGRYRVEVRRQTSELAESVGCFSIAEEPERTEIENIYESIRQKHHSDGELSTTGKILYTSILIERNFYSDALSVLTINGKPVSDHVMIQNLLNVIYWRVGPISKIKPVKLHAGG